MAIKYLIVSVHSEYACQTSFHVLSLLQVSFKHVFVSLIISWLYQMQWKRCTVLLSQVSRGFTRNLRIGYALFHCTPFSIQYLMTVKYLVNIWCTGWSQNLRRWSTISRRKCMKLIFNEKWIKCCWQEGHSLMIVTAHFITFYVNRHDNEFFSVLWQFSIIPNVRVKHQMRRPFNFAHTYRAEGKQKINV